MDTFQYFTVENVVNHSKRHAGAFYNVRFKNKKLHILTMTLWQGDVKIATDNRR